MRLTTVQTVLDVAAELAAHRTQRHAQRVMAVGDHYAAAELAQRAAGETESPASVSVPAGGAR